jgi:hypothetical protein
MITTTLTDDKPIFHSIWDSIKKACCSDYIKNVSSAVLLLPPRVPIKPPKGINKAVNAIKPPDKTGSEMYCISTPWFVVENGETGKREKLITGTYELKHTLQTLTGEIAHKGTRLTVDENVALPVQNYLDVPIYKLSSQCDNKLVDIKASYLDLDKVG